MAFGPRTDSGLVCANGRVCGSGVRAASVRFVAGYVAVGEAVGGSVGGLWDVCGVRVCADRVCDCRCVCVMQRAAAPAVPGGQRGHSQSLLDESGNVMYCLGNQGAVPRPLFFFLLFSLPPSIPLLLYVSCLSHFQLPAGCRLRG